MDTLNSSSSVLNKVSTTFSIFQDEIDTVQDSSVSHNPMINSDDEETRTYQTAPSSMISDKHPGDLGHDIAFDEALIEPFQHTSLPRSLTSSASPIDTLFGQLSMYADTATLPPLPLSIDGQEGLDCELVIESPQVQSGNLNEGYNPHSDNMIYGLVDSRLSQLEKAMDGINGSLNSIAGVVLANVSIQPQLNGPSFTPPVQTTYLPKRRSAQVNALARDVRAVLHSLLGPRMFNVENMMSPEEIDAFAAVWSKNAQVAICCDIHNFKLDFHGSPRSAWNQSACRVFTVHFVRIHGVTYTQAAIQFAFYNRVRSVSLISINLHLVFYGEASSLQASYRNLLSSRSVVAETATRQKRLGRMRALFRKRVRLASQHPMLTAHLAMLSRIGIQGMSSDESDFEERPAKYYVHVPRWRSPELSSWLHAIDQLEMYFRTMARKPKGALPRLRIHSATGPVSDKRFVPGLPKSAYNASWLLTLVDPTHDAMITDEVYSFTHDNRLFSYFNGHNRSEARK